jgi:3-methylfumaryl-CoA hydratase
LFRYSALTFNAHRIHFDLPFTRDVEKYPDLIIHGPLQATFLINAAIKAKGTIPNKFSFRGIHPAFANEPLDLGLKNASHGFELFTSSLGHQCMQANAVWEEKS